ncbi:MAG TPA: amino acid permease [Devosia sp.]|jgi:amino acid transporter|nr:amino acid permease [Devosia sp.]
MSTPQHAAGLRRVLTLWPLIFYGLGVIVGAGIYVALGAVLRRAGETAPLSFLLAGVTAGLTGLCYAELAGRFPEASGGVAYVRHGFGSDRLSQLTGLAMTLAVAVSAASIASGTIQYLTILLKLPVPLLMTLMIGGFTAIAMMDVGASAGLAGAVGAIEIAGLVVAVCAGLLAAPDFNMTGMIPSTVPGWGGTVAGAFIAFFAYIGFETLANMGEEVKDPRRILPLGILGAVGISVGLYVLVVTAVVLSDRATANPLVGLFEGKVVSVFAIVGALAVGNGVLVQIMMLARLFYGMANRGQLPDFLARIHPRTQTPVLATLLAGAIVLLVTVAVPFERLLALSNAITLAIFTLVNLALWKLRLQGPPPDDSFHAPAWVPPVAAASCLALMACEVLF